MLRIDVLSYDDVTYQYSAEVEALYLPPRLLGRLGTVLLQPTSLLEFTATH